MRGVYLITGVLLLTIAISCDRTNSVDVFPFDENVKQLIFLSDESEYQFEAEYYDALIELKKTYPEAVKNMMTINPNRSEDLLNLLKVKENPAIIVVYKNEILATVNGSESVDDIVEPISKVLESK